MARAYYADRISPNMARTPERFLILLGQTIGRSGWQQYYANEIDKGSGSNGMVEVYRSPAEVVNPQHIASLEGKPVTMRHPARFVDSTTASYAGMGHLQNVRVGPRDRDGNITLVADIHIHDDALIEMILSKQLRSISLGYTYDLDDGPREGTYQQRNLVGNHCAIVESGRAGKATYITDASPEGGDDMDGKKIDRLCELLEKLLAQRESNDSDEDGDIRQEYGAGAKNNIPESDLGHRLVPITGEGGEGNINPVAARDALQNLRKLRPFIEESGDRAAMDSLNRAIRTVKAQATSESFTPARFAEDSRSRRHRDAQAFEASASRFHRKDVKAHRSDMESDERSATDSEQPLESFEDQVKRARREAEAKFAPKRR